MQTVLAAVVILIRFESSPEMLIAFFQAIKNTIKYWVCLQ